MSVSLALPMSVEPEVQSVVAQAPRPRTNGFKGQTLAPLLCFVPQLGGGGAEMHLLRLLNHFNRDEWEPLLAVARGGGSYEKRLASGLNARECGWSFLPSSTLRMYSAIPRLREFIRRKQPAAVLAFVDHAVAAVAKALDGLPSSRPVFIAGLQNNLEKTLEHLPRWNARRLRRDIVSAYAQADHIVSLSTGAAETLARLVPSTRGRISIIPNAGYDSDIATLAAEEPACATPAGPWFLGCGRLTAQKDFPTLIDAFARIHGEVGGELWILGEGELRPLLERQIATLGLTDRVRLPGFVKNPFAFMSRATSFVLSSRWEGFGNVITEAMACGTPVISTDCPHGPGEILEAGRWGELTPVGDASALAAAMLASAREPQRFGARAQAAREYVARFEAARITREYEQVIRKTCLGRLESAA